MQTAQRTFLLFIVLVPVIITVMACTPEKKETYQTGDITIYVEESIAPVIEKEVADFMATYKKAKITVVPTTARGAIVKLVNNETRLAIIPRDLDAEEKMVVDKYKIPIKKFRVALDGIAVILNPRNPVDSLTTQQIGDMFSGKITKWKQLHSSVSGAITHAITGAGTCYYELLATKLLKDKQWNASMLPCTTTTQIIQSVEKNENVIGYVGLNWLNSKNLENIKIAKVGDAGVSYDSLTLSKTLLPYQYYIWKRVYPFTRDIYAFSTDQQAGLAAGINVYLMNAVGQRTFLDAGLVPGNPAMPIRLKSNDN